MSKYFRWAELPARDDIHVWEGTTRWGNHDLYPIPKRERNYGFLGFYSYYAISALSIYGFTSASAFVAAGLGVWEVCTRPLLQDHHNCPELQVFGHIIWALRCLSKMC